MLKIFSITIIILSFLLLSSCKQQAQKISQPTPTESKQVREIGAQAAAALTDSLKKHLKMAMQEGGPMQAVNVCSQKAIALTSTINKVGDTAVEVKRTTFKFRNPANMPNAYEKEALNYFQQKKDNGEELPAMFIQKINEQGQEFFYYYQSLKTGKLCLNCHGQKEEMDAKLLQLLEERYPVDKATGYGEGQLRGLVRVKISGLQGS